MTPCLIASARPAAIWLRGSVASVSMSLRTNRGGWNAPTRFLPALHVQAGLAADGRVDHRQRGGRDLDDGNAAVQRRGHEARQVADDAAPHGDHRAVAADVRGQQLVAQLAPGTAHLVPLAGREDEEARGEPRLREQGHDSRGVQLRDAAVGDDRVDVRRAALGEEPRQVGQDAAAHQHVVAASRVRGGRRRRRGSCFTTSRPGVRPPHSPLAPGRTADPTGD